MRIAAVAPQDMAELTAGLAELLRDAVESGASVGFLPPLDMRVAVEYWQGVAEAVSAGTTRLLVAQEAGRVVGTVQLALAQRLNASHRAEVAKLLVLQDARRRGIGRALMQAVEAEARQCERTLLVLDTRAGDPSEQLYLRLGYERGGSIPQYARSADGQLHTTVFLYKLLG